MVKLDLCYISCNSHPLLCFIAETNEKNKYPVPGHFQFSGRDGTGRDGTRRDGSGTGISSGPDRDNSCKKLIFFNIYFMMHWLTRIKSSFTKQMSPVFLAPRIMVRSLWLNYNNKKN